MSSADRDESDNLRRFLRLQRLRRDVDAASRVADAYGRLEAQLFYAVSPLPRLGQPAR